MRIGNKIEIIDNPFEEFCSKVELRNKEAFAKGSVVKKHFLKDGRTKLYGSEHPLASDLTQYHIPLQLPQYTLPFGSLCRKQNVPFSQPVL